jgi:hypothetical protein
MMSMSTCSSVMTSCFARSNKPSVSPRIEEKE